MTPEISYTLPQGNTHGKEWFIWFRFHHADKWHLIKRKEGVNRIKETRKKRAEIEALKEARTLWLKEGWNPVIDPDFKLRHLKTKDGRKQMFLGEALDYALSKKDLSTKTMQGYRGQLNYIKETADKTGHGLLTLDQVDRGVLLDLLDECARDRSFSNHAYNKYSGTLRAMFVELVNYRVIDFNPLRDLREKTIPESNFYATFTAAEKVRITEYLSTTHRPLFVVMSAIYHTGIRPKEMLALRIRDVDLKGQMITIAPDLVAENSKTTNVRRVPINTHLLGLLKSMHLSKYPGEYFLFGSPFIPGQGNRGSGSRMVNGKRITGAMRPDFLTPHTTPVDRDTITKLWKRLIIDGLGINKHLYAAKHTGTDDKVEAGLDLADIQYLYGHKSEAMTERYNKKKRELQARKELLDKSPAFSNGTILKKVS